MKKRQVVIGANLGDEGKGLITDYLSTPDTLVVRFSGGSQAGHTVTLPNGQKHIFHHIGAGAFHGAPTLLTREFICNPIAFIREHTDDLLPTGLTVFVDDQCRITTPYDMILNQAVERKRGNARHGSCGLGINETVTRHNPFPLTVADLKSPQLRRLLTDIRDKWVPTRIGQLELSVKNLPELALSNMLLENFESDLATFASLITVVRPDEALERIVTADHVVFEGAQGLGLDERHGIFPHVTRSRTGLTNVVRLLKAANILNDELTVFYVTRSYLTRHGAGPLNRECAQHPFGWVGDEANVTNSHQGAFRYATLDLTDTGERVAEDMRNASYDVPNLVARLAVTCLDQVAGNHKIKVPIVPFLEVACKISCQLQSLGPTRAHVQETVMA